MTNLADRYSCQEHGTDRHEDCIACEVYGDIDGLVKRIAELEHELAKYLGAEANEYGQSQQRIAELEAEQDRLREALQEIANKELSGWATHTGLPPYDVQSCINIAKIALKEIDT